MHALLDRARPKKKRKSAKVRLVPDTDIEKEIKEAALKRMREGHESISGDPRSSSRRRKSVSQETTGSSSKPSPEKVVTTPKKGKQRTFFFLII